MSTTQSSTTRITVNITRHETCVYEFDGHLDAETAFELVYAGEHEPIDSTIHSEDLDVVDCRQS